MVLDSQELGDIGAGHVSVQNSDIVAPALKGGSKVDRHGALAYPAFPASYDDLVLDSGHAIFCLYLQIKKHRCDAAMTQRLLRLLHARRGAGQRRRGGKGRLSHGQHRLPRF